MKVYVDLKFDILLDPQKDNISQLEILKTFANQHWTPQQSGILINSTIINGLDALWFNFINTSKLNYNPFTQEELLYTEGAPNITTSTTYERDSQARKICIQHYGQSCVICNINFEEVYGEIGKNFIHVHHINHLSKIGKSHTTNPITDLRPVCANCHAMLHRKKEGYSIEYLKSIIKKSN